MPIVAFMALSGIVVSSTYTVAGAQPAVATSPSQESLAAATEQALETQPRFEQGPNGDEPLVEVGLVDVEPEVPPPPLPFDPNMPEEIMPPRPGDENTGRVGQPSLRAQAAAGCSDYYNPNLNRTFTLCGDIRAKYNKLGGPNGFLGLPTSSEIWNPDGIGKRAVFQNNSSIYWRPGIGAFQIGGAIGARWGALGHENSPLGYPTTDQLTNPDGVGKRNWFQGGAIYWHQATGAWEVWGQILTQWGVAGHERSNWGYPTNTEAGPGSSPTAEPSYGGFSQPFQGGRIYWNVVPPICGPAKAANVHESNTNPGTVNLHGGLHGKTGERCNRPVRNMGFELQIWSRGLVGLPQSPHVVVDWTRTKVPSRKNATYHVSNVTAGRCVNGTSMRGSARGSMVDWDGRSYAFDATDGDWNTVTCRN